MYVMAEDFWGLAKSRLAKFRGMSADRAYKILLKSRRERPIKLFWPW